MQLRERGKERASRIDLDYHRQRTWLEYSRYPAALIGLLLSGFYGGWILIADSMTTSIARTSALSTGPLAMVHTSFENDCQQCHSDNLGLPLARDSWKLAPEARLTHLEDRCQKCHQVSGHSRDLLANTAPDRDCATCHREHSGRDKLLTAVANEACVSCHSDLKTVCKNFDVAENLNAVTDFSVNSHGHKDITGRVTFRSLLADEGRIRFDHAQHLQPGQVDPNRKGGFQLSMLAVTSRESYRKPGQTDDQLVQLDCASCHQSHAVAGRSNSVAKEEGRHYAPIDFDKHCSACHQMTYAGQANDMLPLPHVAPREEFEQLLSAKLNRGEPSGEIRMRGDIDRSNSSELINSSVEQAVDAVFNRCQQCHLQEDITPSAIDAALAGTSQPLIASRWLQMGYFDHASHSRIERCEFCHEVPQGASYQPGSAGDHRQVFIRGPESCTPCHRNANASLPNELATKTQQTALLGPKPQPTWASADCVLCHRYHWTRPDSATFESVAK